MITRRSEKNSDSGSRTLTRKAHWIEWLTGVLSTILVAGMIIAVVHDGVKSVGATPKLSVVAAPAEPSPQGFSVAFTVVNAGKRTASGVPVRGTLREGDTIVEEQDVTFDYVPADSEVTGTFLFARDPSQYRLEVKASGFRDP